MYLACCPWCCCSDMALFSVCWVRFRDASQFASCDRNSYPADVLYNRWPASDLTTRRSIWNVFLVMIKFRLKHGTSYVIIMDVADKSNGVYRIIQSAGGVWVFWIPIVCESNNKANLPTGTMCDVMFYNHNTLFLDKTEQRYGKHPRRATNTT